MHNKYYRANNIRVDVSVLEQLPEDGSLSQLTAITVESPVTESPDPANTTPAADSSDPYNAHLPQSFVPIATQSVTEQEAV